MRRLLLTLCLLANVSFVLAPLSMLHAHVDSEESATEIHGGHAHDVVSDTARVEDGGIVDLEVASLHRGTRASNWTHWLPLPIVAAILAWTPLQIAFTPRRRTPDIPILRLRSFWHPLRGPPLSPLS